MALVTNPEPLAKSRPDLVKPASAVARGPVAKRGETARPVAAGAVTSWLIYLWLLAGSTLIPVSLVWDFSWESTIGVDRFWSPPHVATHLGVWLSALLGARLVFDATWAARRGSAKIGVSIFRLRGLAGAWVLLWGGGVMLAAYILDAWWQKAYGLGAGIWTPPQLLKTVGFFALLLGGLMVLATARNANVLSSKVAPLLLCWQGGLLVMMAAVVLSARNYPNWQHGAPFHLISCAVYPALLLFAARGTSWRWGATGIALTYMLLWGAMVWLLPLFPARPLMAPIHNPTEHMLPPPFPLLLIIPAIVLDLICAQRMSGTAITRDIVLSALCGVGFVAAFIPTQWFFSKFLLSAAADNWFFAGGGQLWPFFLKIDAARVRFWDANTNPLTLLTLLLAMAFSTGAAAIGRRAGEWFQDLRR